MSTTNYVWDFATDSYMMEEDENGISTVMYTTQPVKYGSLISQHRDSTTSYYHFDGQGSTWQLTHQNANVTDEYMYGAFGVTTTSSGTTSNALRYHGEQGYYTDLQADHLYVRSRLNDVQLGRWLSRDPLQFNDGINVYIYVRNSPINRADPSGLIGWPGYGAFCGPRSGPGPAIDELDAACEAHDKCLATIWDWLNICNLAKCDIELCKAAHDALFRRCSDTPPGNTANCIGAAFLIAQYACKTGWPNLMSW